jgi:hypothetical protein
MGGGEARGSPGTGRQKMRLISFAPFRGSDLIPRDPRLTPWATVFRPSGFRTACAKSSSVWPHADGRVALFVRGCSGNTNSDSTELAHLITPQHRAANEKSGPLSPWLDSALCRTCSSSRAKTAEPWGDPRDRSLRSRLCAGGSVLAQRRSIFIIGVNGLPVVERSVPANRSSALEFSEE